MIIPVRCFTCGKVMANKWVTYQQQIQEGKAAAQILDDMKLTRYCCRSMLLSHVDILDKMLISRQQAQHSSQKQLMQTE
jgi:DNA-directed RNA polymerase subunit N (RpoN/RPB10)